MKRTFKFPAVFLISICLLYFQVDSHAQKNKVILAIFAHPDDEQTVSPVLAKYAASGAAVYIAVATDGRYGFAPHFNVRDPDSLAAIRARELKCMTSVLGINPPIIMGLHDQFRMKEGMDSHGAQLNIVRSKVIQLFNDLKPDVVITWGSAGLTNHPDHRAVSDVVTEVFSMKQWTRPANLYYTELVTGSLTNNRYGLSTVDSSYLNVRIPVTKAEIEKARVSWNCHKSQYTNEVIDELQALFWKSQNGIYYFRSYRSPETTQYTFFH